MAVAFDKTTFVSSSSASTLTTPAITVSSLANRAGFLGLSVFNNAISNITGDIGGTAGSAIAATDTGTSLAGGRTLAFGVTAPPSGSQTATMSWTTASSFPTLGVITATGVDQTTPFNNGNFSFAAAGTNPSLTITSTNGDLTCDTAGAYTVTLSGGSQTVQWNDTTAGSGAGSTGPGTGTTTHGWTSNGTPNDWAQSGANLNQAASAVGDPIGSANITSSAGRFIGWTT